MKLEHEETEFTLETSGDAQCFTLTLKAPAPMDIQDLILSLEWYLNELIKADRQMSQPNVNQH